MLQGRREISKILFPKLKYVKLINEIIDHFSNIKHEVFQFNLNSIPVLCSLVQNNDSESHQLVEFDHKP